MKKIISAILTLILATTCLFSATLVTSAADATIPDGLVAAYDFEGNNADTQLADKATAGNAKDNLGIFGTVNVNNGVAVVDSAKGSELRFVALEDVKGLTGYTVYTKIKATGDYGANWQSTITIGGVFRLIISGKADGAYTLQARGKASFDYQHPISEGMKFKDGEWIYLAFTAAIDNGKFKTATYYSTDGVTYIEDSKDFDVTFTSMSATGNVVFGGKQDGTIVTSFDDIMIFNRALSANEVKTLASVKLPAPAVPEDTTPADTTPADTTPADTTPKDTTPKDTTPKDTTPAATTPADTTPTSDTEAEKEGGCGAALGFGSAIVAVSALGIAVCAKKRKDD